MKNKGFTLIEIIICITLIVTIGLTSIVVIKKNDNKKISEKKIEYSERIKLATAVYFDKNKQTDMYKLVYDYEDFKLNIKLGELIDSGLIAEELNNPYQDKLSKETKDECITVYLDDDNNLDIEYPVKDESIPCINEMPEDKKIPMTLYINGLKSSNNILPTSMEVWNYMKNGIQPKNKVFKSIEFEECQKNLYNCFDTLKAEYTTIDYLKTLLNYYLEQIQINNNYSVLIKYSEKGTETEILNINQYIKKIEYERINEEDTTLHEYVFKLTPKDEYIEELNNYEITSQEYQFYFYDDSGYVLVNKNVKPYREYNREQGDFIFLEQWTGVDDEWYIPKDYVIFDNIGGIDDLKRKHISGNEEYDTDTIYYRYINNNDFLDVYNNSIITQETFEFEEAYDTNISDLLDGIDFVPTNYDVNLKVIKPNSPTIEYIGEHYFYDTDFNYDGASFKDLFEDKFKISAPNDYDLFYSLYDINEPEEEKIVYSNLSDYDANLEISKGFYRLQARICDDVFQCSSIIEQIFVEKDININSSTNIEEPTWLHEPYDCYMGLVCPTPTTCDKDSFDTHIRAYGDYYQKYKETGENIYFSLAMSAGDRADWCQARADWE